MSDLQPTDTISRQAAIDALDCINGAEEVLRSLPSAQPEFECIQLQVVCADCKHWICHDGRCGFWNHGVKPLDWCCHAERRTDEPDKQTD